LNKTKRKRYLGKNGKSRRTTPFRIWNVQCGRFEYAKL
jgi:hypothetical protein